MSNNPNDKSDAPEPKLDAKASKSPSESPRWVPRWMSERERAAFILAVGIVLAAVILAIGVVFALNPKDFIDR